MAPLDRLADRLNVDLVREQAQLFNGLAIREALALAPWQRGRVSIDPARPALVVGVTPTTVDAVTRFLVDSFGTGADCHLLDSELDGEPATVATLGQLHALLTADPADDMDRAIWVAGADPFRSARSAETLARIVARLRAPGGCPWDREQTTASLRDDVADEAYEVMDAIDSGDDRNLTEELGDVLLAVALQAQIAEDEGRFTLADVYEAVNAKLVRRHPHVFGDVSVDGTDDIVANWNRIKAREKVDAGQAPVDPDDPVARYPGSMPTTTVIERLLAKGMLRIAGGTPDEHPDQEGTFMNDRLLVDQFVGWYATQAAFGYDPEARMREALRRRTHDEQPPFQAD